RRAARTGRRAARGTGGATRACPARTRRGSAAGALRVTAIGHRLRVATGSDLVGGRLLLLVARARGGDEQNERRPETGHRACNASASPSIYGAGSGRSAIAA